jgi:hypothetical protein
MDRAVVLLRPALNLSEQALRTWNARVTDATDLGTLAALNACGHDCLRGLARRIYLEGQFYGFRLAQAPATPGTGRGGLCGLRSRRQRRTGPWWPAGAQARRPRARSRHRPGS